LALHQISTRFLGFAAMGAFFSALPESNPERSGYSLERSIAAAAEKIANAGSMTAFTGAGISVESGIPDFRSAGGLWSKYDPRIYCEYNHFCESPPLFWQMGRELALDIHLANEGSMNLQDGLKEAEPNAAHKALVDLQELGKLQTVITQNIDSLHQRAGSKQVIEIHGTMATARCMDSGKKVKQTEILRQWMASREGKPESTLRSDIATDMWVPRHPETNGILKPNVTMFGEALPAGALTASWGAVMGSPVCLVVGTGLTVAPANMVPGLVKWRFGTLIVLNMDNSGASSADIFLQGPAGVVLPRLVEEVRQRMEAR